MKYKQGIEDLLRKGYAEEVCEENRQPRDTPVWYLPHHPVLNFFKLDKMQIVFDCAAKHRGVSLNDAVLQGPDSINNLMGATSSTHVRYRGDVPPSEGASRRSRRVEILVVEGRRLQQGTVGLPDVCPPLWRYVEPKSVQLCTEERKHDEDLQVE